MIDETIYDIDRDSAQVLTNQYFVLLHVKGEDQGTVRLAFEPEQAIDLAEILLTAAVDSVYETDKAAGIDALATDDQERYSTDEGWEEKILDAEMAAAERSDDDDERERNAKDGI